MRNRIMMVAAEEMNERGVKFTMSDLARRLGISKRTLYEYFDSKEELIGTIVDTALSDVREQRRAVLSNSSLSFQEKLKKVLTIKQNKFSHNDRVPADIKRFLPSEWEKIESFMEEEWKTIESLLKQGVENGCLRPIFVPVVSKMFKGSMNEIVNYEFLAQNNVSFPDMVSYVTDVLLYGIIAADKD